MKRYSPKQILFAMLFIMAISASVPILFDGLEQFSSWSRFLLNFSYGCSFGVLFFGSNALIGEWIRRKQIWIKNPRRGTTISLLSFIAAGVIISLGVPYVFLKYVFQVSPEYIRFHLLFTAFLALSLDMIVVSILFSKYLVGYWMESIQNEQKAKQEKLIAQFESLKNQVNPHFLFNSLNTLSGVVEQQPDEAVPFIKKLSDIYRYVLEQKTCDVVPLSEELSFTQDYVYLMQMRHGKGMDVQIILTRDEGYVAPLALQMLVENAVKHNALSDDMPLQVRIELQHDYLTVTNNRQSKTTLAGKKPEGLDNLVRRYAFLSDKKVEIQDGEKEFVVKLPMLEKPAE